jgi:pRiA4b ORF-3-like protein
MAVYKFRVTFEEYDDVQRDIEIRSTQNFEDFHICILESIKFDNKHDASFYMSDDNWVKGQEITLDKNLIRDSDVSLMNKSRLCDFIIDPHQKIYYVYDFDKNWTFHIELIKILVDEDKKAVYPRCIKATLEPPKQYGYLPTGIDNSDLDTIIEKNEKIFEDEELIDDRGIEIKEEEGNIMGDEPIGFSEEDSEGGPVDEAEEI